MPLGSGGSGVVGVGERHIALSASPSHEEREQGEVLGRTTLDSEGPSPPPPPVQRRQKPLRERHPQYFRFDPISSSSSFFPQSIRDRSRRKRGRAPRMKGTREPPWSDLPPEILSMIGKRLDARMDVLRFRSACSSFRSSIPPPRRDASRFPLWMPCPPRSNLFLRKSTVYALGTASGGAAAAAASASSGGRARWLLKLEESELGRLRMLSLFSGRRITILPREFPEVVDPLQTRIVEICREYTIDCGRGAGLDRLVEKAVMHPDRVGSDLDQCSVYFIDVEGRLSYWKYGDENPIHSDDVPPRGREYQDIAVYRGKVCAVDRRGSVWQFDSSFRLRRLARRIPPGIRSTGFCKHLVVSGGDLYVVDRRRRGTAVSTAFRAYGLDQRRGRWEEVRNLGGLAFFICNHCTFAVTAHELDGCEGDCIYYTDNRCFNRLAWEGFEAFSLPDHSHRRPGDFAVVYSPS